MQYELIRQRHQEKKKKKNRDVVTLCFAYLYPVIGKDFVGCKRSG